MLIAFASLVGIEPVPLADLVKRVESSPLDAIEVNCGPTFPPILDASFGGHLDVDDVLRHGPGPIEEIFAGSGMTITALAPMLNLLTPDESLRSQRIEYFEKTLSAAAILGVPLVVTYGGSPYGMWFQGLPGVHQPHPSNHVEASIRAFSQIFEPLATRAEDLGLKIALETAPRGGGEGNVAHSPELWDRLFDAVASPAIGLSLDPSHLVWLGIPDVSDIIRRYATRIHHFDGKDAEVLPAALARQGILGNSWWRYRLPGLGQLDWAAQFSVLREIGYDYALAIEQEDPILTGLDGVLWSAGFLQGKLLPPRNGGTDGRLL
ncbi:MAG TPA: sugar phosphate isomerase/epimerase [Acidimicrobiales bacterium]|nr:sugar phosphate isomerase/epimerase [Acidimicrobiales bacterium]